MFINKYIMISPLVYIFRNTININGESGGRVVVFLYLI